MGSRIPHSRKSQLNLLVDACAQSAAAELRSRQPGVAAISAELTIVERDGVLLSCDRHPAMQIESPGSPVQVRFEHEGERYEFSAISHGCVCRNLADGRAATLLMLSLPVTIEPARKRRHVRLTLGQEHELYGLFTHVVDRVRQFRARIGGVSEGGLSATVATAHLPPLHPGDLFWFNVESKEATEIEHVAVRLVHIRPVKQSDQVVMGWAFQPTENAFQVADCVSQIADIAAAGRRGGY